MDLGNPSRDRAFQGYCSEDGEEGAARAGQGSYPRPARVAFDMWQLPFPLNVALLVKVFGSLKMHSDIRT